MRVNRRVTASATRTHNDGSRSSVIIRWSNGTIVPNSLKRFWIDGWR